MNGYDSRNPELLAQETGSLISLPEVCLKLRAVLDDPDHTRRHVREVIIHDPALTTRLLRIVNSAYFGLSSTVRDISHALAILGEQDLHNLVVVTSIVQGVNSSPAHGFDLTPFWKRSVFCAVLARNLAEALGHPGKEELFICGLLLNLGKLPLYWREPELCQEVARRSANGGAADWQVERELLGFDHAQVGAALARRWNFSELLAESIAHHHQPPARDTALTCRISALAGRLGDTADLDMDDEPEHLPPGIADADIGEDALRGMLRDSVIGARQVYDAFFGCQYGA